MKLKGILFTGMLAVAIVVLAVFAGMGCVIFDVMSNTATGHETLSPSGAEAGKALVVYDPGISGKAKGAAVNIAGGLQSKGYAVDLCGIKSPEASKTSGYDVIVVGGPVYVGNASSSVKSYLSTLTPDNGTKLGVFGTGSVEIESGDLPALRKDVASVDDPLTIKAAMKLLEHDDADKKCAAFVDALLQ